MPKYDNPLLKKEGYVHITRAAASIGKHPSTIGRWIKAKQVDGVRDGSGLYVCLSALARFLASSPMSATVLSNAVTALRREVIAEGRKTCSSSKAM